MKRVCMALIRFYQRALSARKPYPTCRFTPTCSAYAYEAFETRGFFAGFVLTVWRLLRCSPLSPGGYDPVPRTGFRTMPRQRPGCRSMTVPALIPDKQRSESEEPHPIRALAAVRRALYRMKQERNPR